MYLYGRVTRLYGISIWYWMKLGWIIFSFFFLVHVCMEEATLGFWKGWLSWEQGLFLLRVARGMLSTFLCTPLLNNGLHQNCEGFDSHIHFFSIFFVSLINLQYMQQFGSSIYITTIASSKGYKYKDQAWTLVMLVSTRHQQ